MTVTIQTRRDTAANWTSANPTLAVGELGLETDTQQFKVGDGSTAWASLVYWISPMGCVIIKDVKNSGVGGGTFTSGAWRTRTLNTTDLNTIGGGYSLSSNQFTLPAGAYICEASAPVYRVDNHKARLRNVTDGTDTIIGQTHYADATSLVHNVALLIGSFTIASPKTFELQHRCNTTSATHGFGNSTGYGVSEIFTQVKLWKI